MKIKKNSNLLNENGFYFAAYDSTRKIIIVDDYYVKAPRYVKEFIYWHEMGHSTDRYITKRTFLHELVADNYAVLHIGKYKAIKALNYMWKVLGTVNVYACADIPSRLKELGADVSKMYIKTPNGKVWYESDLKAIL